jgi:hypothetical protein
MDYFYFFLIIIGLVGILVLISRYEKGIKAKYKKTAYQLLETSDPNPKEVKDTIRCLRIYGGRFFKDKECMDLIDRLLVKFGSQLS